MADKRVVLITGANQGIGFSVAQEFSKLPDHIVILTARNRVRGLEALQKIESGAEKLVGKLGKANPCFFHQLDVTQESDIVQTRDFVKEKFGRLDVLINNAGINYDTWQNVVSADLEEVRETFATNLFGVWRLCQAFMPLLQGRRTSNIVNISSGSGSFNSQTGGTPGYSLSKFALNGLTLQLANSLRSANVMVSSVCPGWVRTKMGGAAPKSPEAAAKEIVWVSQLKDFSNSGKFFRAKKEIPW